MKKVTHVNHLLVIALAMPGLFACEQHRNGADNSSQPPEVSVATVISERFSESDQFSGRIQAAESVLVVPRVSGYIQQVHFNEGKWVEQGELLVELDAAPFEAEVARLQAELGSAQAAAQLAQSNLQRAEQLTSLQAMSAEFLDSRRAAGAQAAAQVRSATAALQKARLELSYTRITAPISGRVSYAQITAGNYVQAGQSQLTRLVSQDKMQVYFDVDEHTFLQYRRQTGAENWLKSDNGYRLPVYMSLADSVTNQGADLTSIPTSQHYAGTIDFIDNHIDNATGTIRLRATFDNTEHKLIPGLYASVTLPSTAAQPGILIDEKAIGTDLNNKYVLVANNNLLEYRAVVLGEQVNGLRIVKQGLQADEQIVVNGLQRVRANMAITPKEVEMASAATLSVIRLRQRALEQALEFGSETLTADLGLAFDQPQPLPLAQPHSQD